MKAFVFLFAFMLSTCFFAIFFSIKIICVKSSNDNSQQHDPHCTNVNSFSCIFIWYKQNITVFEDLGIGNPDPVPVPHHHIAPLGNGFWKKKENPGELGMAQQREGGSCLLLLKPFSHSKTIWGRGDFSSNFSSVLLFLMHRYSTQLFKKQ